MFWMYLQLYIVQYVQIVQIVQHIWQICVEPGFTESESETGSGFSAITK
jgi:hypothetical protein